MKSERDSLKFALDWLLLRRTTNQVGVLVIAAAIVNGFIEGGSLLSTTTLMTIGVSLILISILKRYTMNDVVIAALMIAIPLIILMSIGLYVNRDDDTDATAEHGDNHSLPKNTP